MQKTKYLFFITALIAMAIITTPSKLLSNTPPEQCHCAHCAHNQPKEQNQPQDQTAAVVIANFANIVANIIAMGTHPNDKETLAHGGCNIVNSIASVALQACRKIQLKSITI